MGNSKLEKPYEIDEHMHRVAVWTASTAARASRVQRFTVQQGKQILEDCGFSADFSKPDHLPESKKFDEWHSSKCLEVQNAASKYKLNFTHGIAAKLINVYLKCRFVVGGYHTDERVSAIHPPIDSLLLAALDKCGCTKHKGNWRKVATGGWSNFNAVRYNEIIKMVKDEVGDEPLWTIEKYWRGFQSSAGSYRRPATS